MKEMKESKDEGFTMGGEESAAEAKPRFGEHHKTITMATIARAAGVSQGAISSLLNDRDYGIRVSEKTRERVFRVCRELGYVPNDLRAVVRMYPEKGDLCLLVSSDLPNPLLDGFTARIAGAALAEAHSGARYLTVAAFDPRADYLNQPELLPAPIRSGTVSKFLCLGTTNTSLFSALSRRGFPVVSLGHDVALPGVTSIVPDYRAASEMGIAHLFALGHRQIVVLSGPFGALDSQVIELNRGVRTAFEKQGVAIEPSNVFYSELNFAAGSQALEGLRQRTPRPTAIFCLKDAAAAGVLAAAQALGWRVPGELSVLGCSDDPVASQLMPGLTTIRLPAEELGARGVAEVEARVREMGNVETKRIVLPPTLVARQSTAAPAVG